MEFDYSLLVGRIKQEFKTQIKFAEALGIENQRLSRILNNKAALPNSLSVKMMQLLGIENEEAPDYFFKLRVHKR